jgi:hypothetical protein
MKGRTGAAHRSHSQGQGGQAHRVWQAGQDPGSRRPIVTHYEVYDERASDADLLIPALQAHQHRLGRAPRLVSADAAFFSAQGEAAAHAMGCNGWPFPTAPPRVGSARSSRRSPGFATPRSGARAVRQAVGLPLRLTWLSSQSIRRELTEALLVGAREFTEVPEAPVERLGRDRG